MTRTPSVSLELIILRDQQILFGLLTPQWSDSDQPQYGLPGRDIQFGESIIAAARRIIKQDLDCQATELQINSINENFGPDSHYISIGIVASIAGKPRVTNPQDWQKWQWFPTDQIPDNLFISAKVAIDSYLQNKLSLAI